MAGVRELVDVSRRLLKIKIAIELNGFGDLKTHQHRPESLAARYLTASTHMGRAYQLLGELGYCVEFSEH